MSAVQQRKNLERSRQSEMASCRVDQNLQIICGIFVGIIPAFHVDKYKAFYLSTLLYEFPQAFNLGCPTCSANLLLEIKPLQQKLTYIKRLLAVTRLRSLNSASCAFDW